MNYLKIKLSLQTLLVFAASQYLEKLEINGPSPKKGVFDNVTISPPPNMYRATQNGVQNMNKQDAEQGQAEQLR